MSHSEVHFWRLQSLLKAVVSVTREVLGSLILQFGIWGAHRGATWPWVPSSLQGAWPLCSQPNTVSLCHWRKFLHLLILKNHLDWEKKDNKLSTGNFLQHLHVIFIFNQSSVKGFVLTSSFYFLVGLFYFTYWLWDSQGFSLHPLHKDFAEYCP